MVTLPTRGLLLCIRGYQRLISPFLGKNCRFHPTCSQYAIEAVSRFGAFRGIWLTFWRLLRCGPWHPGGYDPVPERADTSRVQGE